MLRQHAVCMTTQERLDAYYAAEARILLAQQVGHGDRSRRNAELEQVRAGIRALESQIAAEARSAAGAPGPLTMVGGFNRPLS